MPSQIRSGILRAANSLLAALFLTPTVCADSLRPARGTNDLRDWLENMVIYHGYSEDEVRQVLGRSPGELGIGAGPHMGLPAVEGRVGLVPYPGGRHPRLGFLDGAIDPQRDTKLSAFTPWDPRSYVVIDLPEAIWSNLGLTYLAHTHIPTVWDRDGIRLPKVEWVRRADGSWASERRLPNGITFGTRALSRSNHVELRWWLRNGTPQSLTGLKAQICVMLGHAAGFESQTGTNKVVQGPFSAARNPEGNRWIITAWDPVDRVWQNPPVPCLHADPRLEDCPPGATREARGGVWFWEGTNVSAELTRLERDFSKKPRPTPKPLEPIPDRLVVLTFDDSVASLHSNVRPLLQKHGFGATFFITEGFSFTSNKVDYMTWPQIAELHRDGFEIGNHTRSHLSVSADTLGILQGEIEHIASQCQAHGIPRPISFAYPGNAIHPGGLQILLKAGIRWARRGAQPEFAYETGRGVAYEPNLDDPLLIPTTGDARPTWILEDLKRAVTRAKDGRIAVLQFHGVPDREHPWVNTPPERFAEYLQWMKDNGYRCIAVRDLDRYVDPGDPPAWPWRTIEQRQATLDGPGQ